MTEPFFSFLFVLKKYWCQNGESISKKGNLERKEKKKIVLIFCLLALGAEIWGGWVKIIYLFYLYLDLFFIISFIWDIIELSLTCVNHTKWMPNCGGKISL